MHRFYSLVELLGSLLAIAFQVPEKRFVYVIRSEVTGRRYIGLTSDFEKRLGCHNAGQNISTAGQRPWRPVTVTEFQSGVAAMQFEKHLKSGSGRAFVRTHSW